MCPSILFATKYLRGITLYCLYPRNHYLWKRRNQWQTGIAIHYCPQWSCKGCFYTCLWFCSQEGVPAPGGWLLPGGYLLLGGGRSQGVPGPGEGCQVWGSAPGDGVPGPGGGGLPGPGGLLWGDGVPGPMGCLVETPRDGYCCGQYTSYWNAFSFAYKITCIVMNINRKLFKHNISIVHKRIKFLASIVTSTLSKIF